MKQNRSKTGRNRLEMFQRLYQFLGQSGLEVAERKLPAIKATSSSENRTFTTFTWVIEVQANIVKE